MSQLFHATFVRSQIPESMKHFIILSLVFLSLNLNTVTSQVNHIGRIDVVKSMNNFVDITLSDFASDISYIPLETNSSCLIDQGAFFLNCGEYYLIGEGHQDLRKFNKSGKFLGIFAKYGQGPGEYRNINGLYYEGESQLVILFDGISNRLLYYSLEGKHIKSYDLPIRPSILYPTSGQSFIGHTNNQLVLDSKYYSYFQLDAKGKVIPIFYEKNNPKRKEFFLAPTFFKSDGQSIYNPPYCDTLYILDQSRIIGKYVLDRGKLRLPDKLLYDRTKFEKDLQRYIFSLGIFPGYQDNFFVCFFHKGKAFVGICNLENESLKMVNVGDGEYPVIINDLDGGLDFDPMSKKYNNSWHKLVWVNELKELLEEDRFLNRKIINPDKRIQLQKFIENLKDEDNPVIVVIKERQ